MPTCLVFDTSNPVPRSEGKVDPRGALKRLARKLNVEIKFAVPWEPRHPSPKAGEIQKAYDPGSLYNVSPEGRKIREALIHKQAPLQIYTGGRPVRWHRTEGGFKEPVVGEPKGKPAIRYKTLRPLKEGQAQPYAAPKGLHWERTHEADIKPGEPFEELPVYETRRKDWKGYMRALHGKETGPAWQGYLKQVREEHAGERVRTREIQRKTIQHVEGLMKHERDYMAGGLKESRLLIRAKGAAMEAARAHPERMIEYKKRLEEATAKRQASYKAARERTGERLESVARRGMNVAAEEQKAAWEAKRTKLHEDLTKAKSPEQENEVRKQIEEHFRAKKTQEEVKAKARGAIGLLKDKPVGHGGSPVSEESASYIGDILQKGNVTAQPYTTERVKTIKKGLDVLHERASVAGRPGVKKSILSSGKIFNKPIEAVPTGYPYLGKLGLGIGAAGLLAGAGLAIHAARKSRRTREMSSRNNEIRLAELPPEAERLLSKAAKRIWEEGQRKLASGGGSVGGSIIRSPRMRRQKVLTRYRRQVQKWAVKKVLARPDLPTHPNAPNWKKLYEQTKQQSTQEARTLKHIGEEKLAAATESHKKALAEVEQKGFARGIHVTREAERAKAKDVYEKHAEALRSELGAESAKRAGRLKLIAAGTLAVGAAGGYALGRYDKSAHQRHEAKQILDLYKPRQPRQPAQPQNRPMITIGISANGGRRKNVEFQANDQEQYQDPDWLQKWAHRKLYHRDYSTLGQAQRVKKYAGRTHRLVRDLNLKRQGLPNIDVRGRERKNEWEKPWVSNALILGTLGAGIFGAKKGIKFLREASPQSRIGQVMEGFRRGHIPGREVKGLQKVGAAYHGIGEELKRWRDRPLKEPLKYEQSKFDVVTGKMKTEAQQARESAQIAEKERLEKIRHGKEYHDFKSRLKQIHFQANKPQQQDQPPGLSWHDVAAGGLESAASYYGIDKLLQKYPSIKGLPKLGLTVGVGAIGTGLAGVALNRLVRQKIAAKKSAQQEMESILRSIKFQDSYYDDLQPLPKTKNQRTLVARDRYIKQIHDRDIARADRLYKHSALIGAGIGALAARKPSSLLRSAGIGAAIGVGAQKATRIYGQSTRDPFGERTVRAKRVEEAPEVIGTAALAGYGLHKIRKLLSSRHKLIRFEEPKRKHRLLAGLAVASAGIPLYRGAGKFARIGLRSHIDKFAGKPMNYGKQVADYIEASQHILNQGIPGKVSGLVLRHPEAAPVKAVAGRIGELASKPGGGLHSIAREHFSSFRSSHTEALQAWSEEVNNKLSPRRFKKNGEMTSLREIHQGQHEKLISHLQDLWTKGYNEKEALRVAANDPQHHQLFKRLAAFKAQPIKNYQKVTAGLAAVPASAGLAVAATTKKNRNSSSAR